MPVGSIATGQTALIDDSHDIQWAADRVKLLPVIRLDPVTGKINDGRQLAVNGNQRQITMVIKLYDPPFKLGPVIQQDMQLRLRFNVVSR